MAPPSLFASLLLAAAMRERPTEAPPPGCVKGRAPATTGSASPWGAPAAGGRPAG